MSEIAILGRGFESLLIALSVVVNAQTDAQWFGILDGVQLSPRRGATRDRKPPMEKSRKAGVQHRPPHI